MDPRLMGAKGLAAWQRAIEANVPEYTQPKQEFPEGNAWQRLSQDPKWDQLGWTDKMLTWLGAGVPKAFDFVAGDKAEEWRQSLGQAAEKFSGGWMGKVLNVFDVAAEGIERTSGLLWQISNDPSYTPNDLQSYWQAGSFAYDFAKLPEFKANYDNDGTFTHMTVSMDEDLPGAAGMIKARKRIQELVSQGVERKEALAQVRTEMYADMEMLSIRAAKQDMLGHIFLDPLNWFMPWIKPIDTIKATAIYATGKKTSKPLIEALMKLEPEKIGKLTKLDDATRLAFLRGEKTIEGLEDIQNVFSKAKFTDTLKEMSESNQLLTMWDKVSIFATGGMENFFTFAGVDNIPIWARNTMEVLAETGIKVGKKGKKIKIPIVNRVAKLFTLTDDSKAWEVMYAITDNIIAKLPKDNPQMAMDFLESMHLGLVSPKYGHSVMTVQGRAAQIAVRSAIVDAKQVFNDFTSIVHERQILDVMARALGPDYSTHDVLRLTVKQGREYVMDLLRKNGDETVQAVLSRLEDAATFPITSLKQMPLNDIGYAIKAYSTDEVESLMKFLAGNDMPYTTDLFYAHLTNSITESIDVRVTTIFGIQEVGVVRKFAEAMKAGQSLAFLRINPGFMMRNFLNNEMTMIGRGLSPFIPESMVKELFDDLGYSPLKATEAFTMAGDTLTTGARKQLYQPGGHMQDALIGERQFLDTVREWIGDRPVPIDFGEFARKSEQWASERSFYSGYMQGWNQFFWRPGHGFDLASDTLSPALQQQIGRKGMSLIEATIQDARAEAHLDDVLFKNAEISPNLIMGRVENAIQEEFGLHMPQETVDYLKKNLGDAMKQAQDLKDPAILDNFFSNMNGRLKTHIDTLAKERATARVLYAEALTEGLGYSSALPILFGDTMDDMMHAHIGYSMRMAMIDTSEMSWKGKKSFWKKTLADNRDYWGRQWNRMEDTVKGMKQGMKKGDIPFDPRIDVGIKKYRKTWDDFFDARDADYGLWDDVFDKKKGVIPENFKFKDWDDMKVQHDRLYVKAMTAEMEALEEIDDILVGMMRNDTFGDMKLASPFKNWRQKMIDMRRGNREKTRVFMRNIRDIKGSKPRAAEYQRYFTDVRKDWTRYAETQRTGLVGMYGEPDVIENLRAMSPASELSSANRNLMRAYGVTDVNVHGPRALQSYLLKGYTEELSEGAMEWIAKTKLDINDKKMVRAYFSNPQAMHTVPTELMEEALIARRNFHGPPKTSKAWDNFWTNTQRSEPVTAGRFPLIGKPQGVVDDAPLIFYAGRNKDSVRGGVVYATTMKVDARQFARGPSGYVEEIYFNLKNPKHLTEPIDIAYLHALWEGNPDKKVLTEAKRWMKEMQDFGIDGAYLSDGTMVAFKERNVWRNSKTGGPKPFTGYDGPYVEPKPGVWEALHSGGPPMDVGYDQATIGKGDEIMDLLEMESRKAISRPPTVFDDVLDDAGKIELEKYINKTKGQMHEARTATVSYAGWRRDTALLNYRRRYKFDQGLGMLMPYSFWMTHSIGRWALHSIDRPQMLTSYLRMRKMMQTAGSMKEGFPSRLQSSIRVPILDPPDWMGDTFFADPARALFPFDQMAFPYEKYVQGKQDIAMQAENLIRRKVQDGAIREDEAVLAMQTKQGKIWDEALFEASKLESSTGNAWDIANTFSSMHAPIQWGFNYLMGKEEDIGPLGPAGRAVKQFYGLLGINPVTGQEGFGTAAWDVGSSVRQQLGLHPFDKWEDYRIDRAVVNIVATDPEVTAEMGQRAMIDRQGPLFQRAASQAAKQYARGSAVDGTLKERISSVVAFVFNQAGIPVYTYPEGEEHQRLLKDEFQQAYTAEYQDGVPGALKEFFDEYPEYEARLALWKGPEERMSTFMIDQMWGVYYDLPTLHRRQMVEALGEDFQKFFMNSDTRNYEAIEPAQLYMWLTMMGADPPGSMNVEAAPIHLASDDVAMRAQVFYDSRNMDYPNFVELQNDYFALDDRSPDRKNHPVKEYWAWREDFFHKNPDLVPYIDDDYQLRYPSSAAREQAFAQAGQVDVPRIEIQLAPGMYAMAKKAAAGKEISIDIKRFLEQEAHKMGISYHRMLELLR